MSSTGRKWARIIFSIYLAALHLVVLYFIVERAAPALVHFSPVPIASVADPAPPSPVETPLPIPTFLDEVETPTPLPAAVATPSISPQYPATPGDELLVPVVGVRREQLTDTFAQSRSDGRVHDAIDIMAPGGTPVVAAADGQILKFWDSKAGGITIYQITADKRYFLYYAHLASRAGDIKEGDFVRRGTTIGFVGDSGNAGAGNYHLHFSIAVAEDPKRYWKGTYINPFPLLRTPSKLP
jgi:murein DD-endopeptidase MepM/ murein hydrolase activator NlpD